MIELVRRRSAIRGSALVIAAGVSFGAAAVATPASAAPPVSAPEAGRPAPPAPSTSTGYGGAVSSVDPEASRVGLEVLRKGGNAADAAVATAAALGVTEPYSAGIGGGGYFVHFDAETGEVTTIDGRETAPAAMESDAFIDPATGSPYSFANAVSSGLSVGVPGTVATWEAALEEYGTESLKEMLKPSILLATRGFRVDQTFRDQTLANQARFAQFPDTAELFLPGGDAPEVGTTFRNPDLATTLREIALRGTDAFYEGAIADEIAAVVQDPPITTDTATLPAYPGFMTADDLADYEVLLQDPTHVEYRDLDVFGMAPSSSGGTTVGESLNILENFEPSADDPGQALHLYLESTAHAFADRNAYVGDPAFVDVPTETLLSQEFADSRACEIDPEQASPKPVAPGDLNATGCEAAAAAASVDQGMSTTHLSVVDRWGNAVAYTLTIEQTGGSGMTVPDRGFLLNNELTDFSFVPNPADPNIVEPGKRPRSSMSPTIVLDDGEVRYVVGTPGGSTIITTVVQVLLNRIDLGMTMAEAVAAPRATQRNTAATLAEADFIDQYADDLAPYGQGLTQTGEIGAAAAIEVDPDGLMIAVAEPERRGGGTGLVLEPAD